MHVDTHDRIVVPWVLRQGYEPVAEHLLRRYFGQVEGTRPCTGAWFETIGRRWDDPATLDVIDACDLLAVQTLCVEVPARAAIAILGRDAARIADELRRIPVHTRLVDVDDDFLLARDGAPQRLWSILRSYPGVGPTTAGKLLAHKRPHLFPIVDSVVEAHLRLSGRQGLWTAMRRAVVAEGQELYKRAGWLAEACDLAHRITPLRVIDVVTWMHSKDQARSVAEAARVGLPAPRPRDPVLAAR